MEAVEDGADDDDDDEDENDRQQVAGRPSDRELDRRNSRRRDRTPDHRPDIRCCRTRNHLSSEQMNIIIVDTENIVQHTTTPACRAIAAVLLLMVRLLLYKDSRVCQCWN